MAFIDAATAQRLNLLQDPKDEQKSGIDEVIRKAIEQITSPLPQVPMPEQLPAQDSALKGVDFKSIVEKAIGTDWESEAERVLERRGLKRPTDPGQFKISPWMALAALGPALGALVGGRADFAAQAAAGGLGVPYERHREAEKLYRTEAQEYAKAAGDLAGQMGQRASQQFSMLAPYFMMSYADRLRHGIDVAQLHMAAQNLELSKRGQGLQVMSFMLQRDQNLWTRGMEQKRYALDVLQHTDKVAHDKAALELAKKDQAWKVEYQKAQLAIERGQLGEAARHHRAMEGIAASKAGGEDVLDKFKVAIATKMFMDGDIEGLKRMLFGSAVRDLAASEKAVIDEYTRLLPIMARGKLKEAGYSPEQIEQLRQNANAVRRRLNMPEFPATPVSQPGRFNVVEFLKGLLNF